MSSTPPLKADGSRYTHRELVELLDNDARAKIMAAGMAPAFDTLEGWEFGGINTLAITRVLGFQKFMKGFYMGPPRSDTGPSPFTQGYNIDVRQNGLSEPYLPKPSKEHPRRYGFYRVYRVDTNSCDARYPNALLLNYGLGANGASPTGLLRDYLVQVYPDDPELLLGQAFLNIFSGRLGAGFFALKRLWRTDYRG